MIVGGIVLALFGINDATTMPNFSKSTFSGIFSILWLLGEIISTLLGIALILAGLFLFAGGTTIAIKHDQLTTRDHLGPLRWTRSLNLQQVNDIDVIVGTTSTNGGPKEPTNNVTALIANLVEEPEHMPAKPRPFIIAWGYPKDWMLLLGEAIKEDARRAAPRLGEMEIDVQIGSDDEQADAIDHAVDQPAESDIELSSQPDGLTFNIPPSGIMRGTKGLGCFTVLWNSFILLFTGLFVFTMIFDDHPNVSGPSDPWALLFLLPFIAVGVGMALYTTHLGRSSSRLVVIGSGENAVIAFHRISPIRKPRELSWASTALTHLCVGDSNMSVNDEPLRELQFYPKKGKKVGILAQLDDEELEWIAWELRQQTGLPKIASKA